MKTTTVKDLMVPLEEYATVSIEATLFEAVMSLEKAQEEIDRSRYKYLHRAILVYDKDNKIVGKISQLDVLRALEPKYGEIGPAGALSRSGLSPQFMQSMLDRYSLWDSPLTSICGKAVNIKVSSFMHTPLEGEYVPEDATLAQAIHQFVMCNHQSLLVTKDENIIGILRLTDVFSAIFHSIKACNI